MIRSLLPARSAAMTTAAMFRAALERGERLLQMDFDRIF
jgi:hypothetical protein